MIQTMILTSLFYLALLICHCQTQTNAAFIQNSKHTVILKEDDHSFESKAKSSTKLSSHVSNVKFTSPLLDAGYPPAVKEARYFESSPFQQKKHKPLLLYIPGFDGTLIAPFLQFPELSTEFDVHGMSVDMDDRSTYIELKNQVLNYLLKCTSNDEEDLILNRPVYLMGESFGGVLALDIALTIKHKLEYGIQDMKSLLVNLQGLILVNPATSYLRSELYEKGPPITKLPSIVYPFALMTLLPLFTDPYSFPQLLLMLQAKALPSVANNIQREAYIGRIAFSLPIKLKFMPQDTLSWRLNEWLSKGVDSLQSQISVLKTGRQVEVIGSSNNNSTSSNDDNSESTIIVGSKKTTLVQIDSNRPTPLLLQDLRILIVAGEVDKTLPSVEEAENLCSLLGREKTFVHIVNGAGHASTLGSRVDITAVIRKFFPELLKVDYYCNNGNDDNICNDRSNVLPLSERRTEMKDEASKNVGEYFGLESRYDGANVGLMPWEYWSKELYEEY